MHTATDWKIPVPRSPPRRRWRPYPSPIPKTLTPRPVCDHRQVWVDSHCLRGVSPHPASQGVPKAKIEQLIIYLFEAQQARSLQSINLGASHLSVDAWPLLVT